MSIENDKILNCYDCVFMGDKSENYYQIRLNKDSTDYFKDIIADIFFKIDAQSTKPAYIDSLLNHHFNYCKEDKKDFIFDLEIQIKFISRFVFSNERLFQSTLITELFKDWIEKKKLANKNQSAIVDREFKKRLKVPVIALIHVHDGPQITRDNADEIASDNGYNSKYSGEGLYQEYTSYSIRANRIAISDPFSKKQLENKIQLFEMVYKKLSDKGKVKIKDEIDILKTFIEKK